MIFVKGSHRRVLEECLRYLHRGGRLLTHPNPASVKLFHSPVRSILIEEGSVDESSILLMERALYQYDQIMTLHEVDNRNLMHYEMMDQAHIDSALEELARWQSS